MPSIISSHHDAAPAIHRTAAAVKHRSLIRGFRHRADSKEQLLRVEWLLEHQENASLSLPNPSTSIVRLVPGDQNNRQIGTVCLHEGLQLPSIHSRHTDVADETRDRGE